MARENWGSGSMNTSELLPGGPRALESGAHPNVRKAGPKSLPWGIISGGPIMSLDLLNIKSLCLWSKIHTHSEKNLKS